MEVFHMGYAMEFRVAVAWAYDECGSSIEVAEMFGCSASWVRRLIQRRRQSGSLEPLPSKLPDNSKLDDEDLEKLRQLIANGPDMTLAELAEALGNKVSVPTVWRATQAMKLPLKKKTRHAAEQDRPDVKAARATWFEQFADVTLDQLVFLDEFGATTNMTRAYARGPRGKRVVCKTPHGHWKILGTIAAMTVGGMLACGTFDGATDTETFLLFLKAGLIPRLRPGQIVVMDNLWPHKNPKVDQLITSVGARVMYLPPYSPDYNPIEMAINKVKSLLRKLGKRTVSDLLEAIGPATQAINVQDATNFIKHCGYCATRE
jgi:transposase